MPLQKFGSDCWFRSSSSSGSGSSGSDSQVIRLPVYRTMPKIAGLGQTVSQSSQSTPQSVRNLPGVCPESVPRPGVKRPGSTRSFFHIAVLDPLNLRAATEKGPGQHCPELVSLCRFAVAKAVRSVSANYPSPKRHISVRISVWRPNASLIKGQNQTQIGPVSNFETAAN